MDDLKLTQVCAKAMGFLLTGAACAPMPPGHPPIEVVRLRSETALDYDPLHNDAQAMALVKRFELTIFPPDDAADGWDVGCEGEPVLRHFPNAKHGVSVMNADLNRAIVECVAKMHATAPAPTP